MRRTRGTATARPDDRGCEDNAGDERDEGGGRGDNTGDDDGQLVRRTRDTAVARRDESSGDGATAATEVDESRAIPADEGDDNDATAAAVGGGAHRPTAEVDASDGDGATAVTG